jgi:hypothetical protein
MRASTHFELQGSFTLSDPRENPNFRGGERIPVYFEGNENTPIMVTVTSAYHVGDVYTVWFSTPMITKIGE